MLERFLFNDFIVKRKLSQKNYITNKLTISIITSESSKQMKEKANNDLFMPTWNK